LKISKRDNDYTKAYIGQDVYHESISYPTNWLIPENGDPSKYRGISDNQLFCEECKKPVLIKTKNTKTETPLTCPFCSGRLSHVVRDKAYGPLAMTPSTLNFGMGSSTNNESGGVMYHPSPGPNQDTFSGNLGK